MLNSAFNIISGTTGVLAQAVTRGQLSFNAAATILLLFKVKVRQRQQLQQQLQLPMI